MIVIKQTLQEEVQVARSKVLLFIVEVDVLLMEGKRPRLLSNK